VYELLTQQYELAKVQEAKEIPTVKVLDAPIVPRKILSSAHDIVILGTMLGITLAMTWIVGKTWWEAVEVSDPRRVLRWKCSRRCKHVCRSSRGTGQVLNKRAPRMELAGKADAMSEQDQDKDAERDEP